MSFTQPQGSMAPAAVESSAIRSAGVASGRAADGAGRQRHPPNTKNKTRPNDSARTSTWGTTIVRLGQFIRHAGRARGDVACRPRSRDVRGLLGILVACTPRTTPASEIRDNEGRG